MSFIHSFSRADLHSKHLPGSGPGAGSQDAALSETQCSQEPGIWWRERT